MELHHKTSKLRRENRIRAKAQGTKFRPRFTVFRSNKYTYVQLVDDISGKTVASISQNVVKDLHNGKNKVAAAFEIGKEIAKVAAEKNISKVIFDRGSYRYHGRVKSLADGAREGGLDF